MTTGQWLWLWAGLILGSLTLWWLLILRLARKARTLLQALATLVDGSGAGEALHSPKR